LLPTSVTADPADANALFLRFDGSVQALCDDLDKPSFEPLQTQGLLIVALVTACATESPDSPSNWTPPPNTRRT